MPADTIENIVRAARQRGGACFLCAWIEQDLEKHSKLTDWPYDHMGRGIFSKSGKESHLKLEGLVVKSG